MFLFLKILESGGGSVFYFSELKKSSGGERTLGLLSRFLRAPFQFSKRSAGEATKFGRSGVKLLGVVGAARLECGEPAAESGAYALIDSNRPGPPPMGTLLFLCTGNYYRSRFAEELFNHRAQHAGLSWIAQSPALAIERGISNVGSVAPLAVRALEERGVTARGANRPPQQCTITDLKAADRIVALNETEHRPLLLERFPGWEQHVEYWHVGDVDVALPAAALNSIENEILRIAVPPLVSGADAPPGVFLSADHCHHCRFN